MGNDVDRENVKTCIKVIICTLVVFRFEEEILTSQTINDVNGSDSVGSKVIIGSGTFHHVQTQLNNQRPRALEAESVATATQKPDTSTTKPRLTFSGIDIILLTLVCNFICITNLQ